MPEDEVSLVVVVLGPAAVGILLAALIWYIQRKWPRGGGKPE